MNTTTRNYVDGQGNIVEELRTYGWNNTGDRKVIIAMVIKKNGVEVYSGN